MTLDKLQADKIIAMKNNDTETKNALSGMIDAIQKAGITSKGRVEITEQVVNETLIKYQKSIQEQVDTCPKDRIDLGANLFGGGILVFLLFILSIVIREEIPDANLKSICFAIILFLLPAALSFLTCCVAPELVGIEALFNLINHTS